MNFNLTSDYYLSHISFTIIALVVTLVLLAGAKRVVDLLFRRVKHRMASEVMIARTTTLSNLFKNILEIVVLIIALLIILSNWGINIIPILTGASILGLAVSFGAQTLVKDMIAGIFIILEDQYHIGDRITVDKYEGEVYNVTLRLTVLKDKAGNLIYIPNSSITSVIRHNMH